ncbi:MAG TPA: class I SAM-dependent methyltransferase [Myxococcota bacterium]|nr:class I SAM-dependent methyltransferase [Myxococcota bacterium]MDP7299885.1 class I SAM-dependent methyltransferase [Myxococcota bacterium]HJO24516.1 class I SAM-dependent methyltransferase [Myxococcota bacterium]
MADLRDTREAGYAKRLETLSAAGWKRWLDVQAPYRWNVRRLELGYTLDIGCGIGRNLAHLGCNGVGLDHNPHAIEVARERGCIAFTPEEFATSGYCRDGSFDALLFAHVVEHMHFDEAAALVGDHLRYLRPGGRVALITPQQAGFRSDPTHVEYMDPARLRALLDHHGLAHERSYSFPFPRIVGGLFPHNEFVVVGLGPGAPAAR